MAVREYYLPGEGGTGNGFDFSELEFLGSSIAEARNQRDTYFGADEGRLSKFLKDERHAIVVGVTDSTLRIIETYEPGHGPSTTPAQQAYIDVDNLRLFLPTSATATDGVIRSLVGTAGNGIGVTLNSAGGPDFLRFEEDSLNPGEYIFNGNAKSTTITTLEDLETFWVNNTGGDFEYLNNSLPGDNRITGGSFTAANGVDAVQVPADPYSADDWLVWGGGGGAANPTALILAEGSNDTGIAVQLDINGGGADWALIGAVPVPAVNASIFLPITGDPASGWRLRLKDHTLTTGGGGQIPLGGVNGNGVRIARSNAGTLWGVQGGGGTITIFFRADAGDTLADIRGFYNASLSDLKSSVGIEVVGTVDESTATFATDLSTSSASNPTFQGGTAALDLVAEINEANKTATIHYDEATDTLDQVADAINDNASLSATLIYGTTGSDSPEAPSFTKPFASEDLAGGALGGDGAGGATVTLQDETTQTEGVSIKLLVDGADADWGFRGEDRVHQATLPYARITGASSANYAEIRLPTDMILTL